MERGARVIYRLDYNHRETAGRLQLIVGRSFDSQTSCACNGTRGCVGRFLTNEERPAMWWLELTSKAKRQLKTQ